MESLPVEIIELILGDGCIRIEDVVNSSLTCKHVLDVVRHSGYIWKNMYLKMWPHCAKLFSGETNWYEETKYVYDVRRKVQELLKTMSPKFYTVSDLSNRDLWEWKDLIEEQPRTYDYVIDYLTELINDMNPINSIEVVPLITSGNKTLRYYSLKVIQYLRHIKITTEYNDYMKLPEKQRILEKGAVMIAQWCQPEVNVNYDDVCEALDDLTNQALDDLKLVNPNHPLFKVPEKTLEIWKIENLDENQFNGLHSMQIVEVLELTLFKKNKFSGNVTNFYMPQNSYINVVLDKKYGLPITLSIVYESVARRMGVNCEPMNIPAHFLLRFQKDQSSHSVLFIDAFNEGQMVPRGICPHSHSSPDKIPRATAYKVLRRMAANLEESLRVNNRTKSDLSQLRSVLELLVLLSPNDLNCIVNLSRLCMSLNMDTKFIVDIMMSTEYEERQNAANVLQMLSDYEIHRLNELFDQCQPKKRLNAMQYAVGMVMQHSILNYKGVITDWTPVCRATAAWQKSMDVDKLQRKGNQPFYNVIVEDGTQRYVAEENIQITHDTGFLYLNEEVGRHFSHFFVNHYVPNAEKEKEYPDDTAVRQKFYQVMMWGS